MPSVMTELEEDEMSDTQADWRSCSKCQGMHYAGLPGNEGVCPAGGQHDQVGSFAYLMALNAAPNPNIQTSWASCPKCQGLHFAGFPDFKGVCPAGGAHTETGSFAYSLLHDVQASSNVQLQFRACKKCQGLFYGPFKGKCPAGGEHDPTGSFNYGMVIDGDTATFDSGPVTSSLPLGGSVHIVMTQAGNFTLSTHAHDSGFDNIDYAIAAVLMSASGIAFTFQHAGHVEGTSAGLPLGTPNRNDDFTTTGTNSVISRLRTY
jgi:RNA polymerase subunit RPABC4/transcription elongation factor Spt4